MAAKKSVKKSGRKSGGKQAVELVPQQHGGALRRGSLPGNTPGTGRPPSEVRAICREAFAVRIPTLAAIADSDTAPNQERIAAIDRLGKYAGLSGAVSMDDVKARLREQVTVLRSLLPADTAELVLAKLGEVWR